MSTDILLYLAAFAGGLLGAAFGAIVAFVFTGLALLVGIAVLIGSGDATFITQVAFGPFFGPHVSFAAGVGAAAFAARRGWLPNGRDVGTPLVGLGRPSVLVVGGLFGVFGLVVSQLIAVVPWFGSNTDTVAITVVISGLVARVAFGRSGILGASASSTGSRFRPTDDACWLRYQEKWPQVVALGCGAGMIAAWAAVALSSAYPNAPAVYLLGFGISAASLMFLATGVNVPVTHHITIIGALGAIQFLGITHSPLAAVLIGTAFGILSACAAELFSRLWLIRGDSHIDPPASAIWPMTTLVLATASVLH